MRTGSTGEDDEYVVEQVRCTVLSVLGLMAGDFLSGYKKFDPWLHYIEFSLANSETLEAAAGLEGRGRDGCGVVSEGL